MEANDRAAYESLRKNYHYLTTALQPRDILPSLFASGLISFVQKQEVECAIHEGGPAQGCVKLLDVLMSNGSEGAFQKFMDVLRNQPHLEYLVPELQSEYERQLNSLQQQTREQQPIIEDPVTCASAKSLSNSSGTAIGEETISEQGLVASSGIKGLYTYSFIKTDLLQVATSKELQDSTEEKLIIDHEAHDIRSEYNILFTKVLEDLVSQGVNVRRFVLFLKKVPGYAGKPFFHAELSELEKASDLVDVFDVVGDRCSWFNHSFLEQIIKAYCEGNKMLEKAHKDFCAHLRRYCQHRVRKCPLKDMCGSGGKEDVTLVMKVDMKWDDITVEQVEEVVFNVARILKIERYLLMLSSVKQGCMQLTLLVPSYIRDAAFPLTTEQEAAMVATGVTDLQCGSYHFSQQQDAPSRLHSGFPRAIPGLEEVEVESVQEGTQDQSREYMYQAPPQLVQGMGFHHVTYNILSCLDDAQSLCRAERVCRDWRRVIADELLWKKLIERKVKTDPVWRGLSQRRGWDKYLSLHVTHSEGEFYRQLYPNIIRDINNLQINWKNGHHTLTRIECGEIAKGGGVYCLQYDDKRIISGHVDNTIKIWNRKSLKCCTVLQGHTDWVRCLQYDDRVIITGSDDSTIRVWDMNDGSMLNKLDHHRGYVNDLKFNSDTMVTGSQDHTVAVWDMMSPMDIFLRKELKGHKDSVIAVDFDEEYIVSGSSDSAIKVWRTSTGECVHTLQGHRDSVYCLQYRGNHIVSGSSDHTVRIWDIESGACLKILEGHNDICCIRFDDKRIVSGSYDGEIKVWDFQAALDPRSQADTLCLQTLRGHSGGVFSLQFDDFQVVSGSVATILIWDFLDTVPPGPIDTDQSDNKKALT